MREILISIKGAEVILKTKTGDVMLCKVNSVKKEVVEILTATIDADGKGGTSFNKKNKGYIAIDSVESVFIQ